MRKTIAIFLSLIMILAALPLTAEAYGPVNYIDENGVQQTITAYDSVYSGMSNFTWANGWYVVSEDTQINTRVTVSGTVNVLLCDGVYFNAKKGFEVVEGNTLNFYAQTASTGTLVIDSPPNYASGIGTSSSSNPNNCGTVTFNGGNITVSAGWFSAAVGGGQGGGAGTIIINRGTLNAAGSSSYGTGIGSGSGGHGGNIIINGGTVTAGTSSGGAAIGSGNEGSVDSIAINGGSVTATSSNFGAAVGSGSAGSFGTITVTGGTLDISCTSAGAGIGSGRSGNGSEVLINGGNITASGSTCIGSGSSGSVDSVTVNGGTLDLTASDNASAIGGSVEGAITINDGNITSTAGQYGAVIGSCYGGKYGSLVINGGIINANGGSYSPAIGGGYAANSGTIYLNGGKITAVASANGYGIGKSYSGNDIEVHFNLITPGDFVLSDNYNSDSIVLEHTHYIDGTQTPVTPDNLDNIKVVGNPTNTPISYIDENGSARTVSQYSIIDSSFDTLETGWYAVVSDTAVVDRISVSGNVNLILSDGYTLTATNGIGVDEGNSLTVFGQNYQTGAIETGTPDHYYSGIGSDNITPAGTLTVNGGVITARGGWYAAGIGSHKKSYGNITINRGTVTAFGGVNAAGIGNGQNASSGFLTINGGTVNATGGNYGAGIGGGLNSQCGRVTINGGTVSAKGGYYAAAIGGGDQVKSGFVYINGGNVTADSNGINTYGLGNGQTANSSVHVYIKWTNLTDRIFSVSYKGDFHFEKDFIVEGTDFIATEYNSANHTIVPVEGYVKYIDANGAPRCCFNYTTVTDSASNTVWTNGWYVVFGDVTVSGKIAVSGAAGLILCDGATLKATSGIVLEASNTLEIFGQDEQSGSLVARGDSNNAGIGGYVLGSRNYRCGTLNINGGVIRAIGGANSAGIGGGGEGTGGGIITVNNGTVTAIAGVGGAGIGGALKGIGGRLTVNGGTVNATGRNGGAGIGSGAGCVSTANQFNVTVNGGTVNAAGSQYTNTTTNEAAAGAGIGAGGCYSSDPNGTVKGTVTINGGNVTANGVTEQSGKITLDVSAGIGTGTNCTVDSVVINLGWTSLSDSVYANRYTGTINLTKSFYYGTTILESGSASNSQIAKKTLLACMRYDMNDDGEEDIADIALLLSVATENTSVNDLTALQKAKADLNHDTVIDGFDAAWLDRYYG